MKSVHPVTVGRIVLYQAAPGKVLPAIIVNALENTSYENSEVNLKVFCDGETDQWVSTVPHDQVEKQTDTWHWPDKK